MPSLLHRKKLLMLFALIAIVILLGIWGGKRMKLEENIYAVLPGSSNLAKYEQLIAKSANGNRLIFILKSEKKQLDSLIATANVLQETLETAVPDSLISEISITNNPATFLDYLSDVYQNLPSYTDSSTLQNTDWSEATLREKVSSKLRTLFTPAGAMVKQSLTRDPFDLSAPTLSRLQQLQADKNFTVTENCIVSTDSTYLLGFVKLSPNIKKEGQQKLLQTVVDSSLASIRSDEIKTHVFGAALIAEANAERIKSDIMLTVNIASVLLLLVLCLYYRSIRVLPGFLLSSILGGSAALFLLSFKQGTISVIALGMGSVLMGSIVDCSVHVLTHLKKTGDAALTRKHLRAPILASSITTSVAFLGLLLIGSPALNDLAIFAALSLFFGALFAIWVLPTLFEKVFSKEESKRNFIDKLMAFPFHKNRLAVSLCLLLIIIPLFFIQKVGFTKDLNELNYMPPRFAEAQNELNNASNTLQSSVLLLVEEDNLQHALSATQNVLDTLQGLPIEVHSALDILLNEEKRQANFTHWKTFWTKEKIVRTKKILASEAEKLGLDLRVFAPFLAQLEAPEISQTYEMELQLAQNYISIDSATNSTISTIVLKVEKEDKSKIKDLVKAIFPNVAVIDQSGMFDDLVLQVKTSLKKISLFLLIMIVGVLFVYFRNPEVVLLSVLPIFLSCATTIGLMGALHIPFNMINIIVTIFIFGLAIDYTIFSLDALISDYREGGTNFQTGKSAILLSALTTFIGIGVLIFAKHPSLHSIATAGMVAIVSAFIYAIVFLPFLFDILVKNRTNKKFEPITFHGIYDTFVAYSVILFGSFALSVIGAVLYLFFFIPFEKRQLLFHTLFNRYSNFYIKRVMFPNEKCVYENPSGETFEKPALILSNHQSLIDTPIVVGLTTKIIILTKNWVRRASPFAVVARLADFYSVEKGLETVREQLKAKMANGFSIVVFPEGSRAEDKNLRRFHRGAFLFAEELELDIVPVMIHDTLDTLHRNQIFGQRRQLHVNIGKRIAYNDTSFGTESRERFKNIREFYKKEFFEQRKSIENTAYYHELILSNYKYKGVEILKEVKAVLKANSNFQSLDELFKNDKKTLLIDESNGVLTLAQNLVNEHKQVSILSSETNIIKACFSASDKNIYYENAERVHEKFEQIIYIASEQKLNVDGLLSENGKLIFLSNGKI